MLSARERAATDAVREEEVVALLRDLVRAPSVNPPGNEAAAAAVVAERLEAAGIRAALDEVEPGRPNVLAEIGEGEGPTLLWNAHLDTVPPGRRAAWTADPFGGEIRDGRLFGRGASDDKGGVAVMAAAAIALARAGGVRGRLRLAFVVGEETGHLGTRAALGRGLRADLAVVGEWSGAGRIGIGYRGALWLAFETRGRAAHGSRPHRGLNAIDVMTEQVLPRLKATPMRFDRHPVFMIQEPTWSVGTIEGGISTNVVADHCRATTDLRLVPGQDPGAVLDLLRERLAGIRYPNGDPAPVDVTVLSAVGPFITPVDHPVVTGLAGGIRDALGVEPEYFGKTGVSDANVLAHEGKIPSVAYGPGNASGHEPDEYVEIAELMRCTRVLVVSALRTCGGTAP
jgi:acetylornithine deacetylase/succinyl-diaminopimelate desuccinylase family protein